jgi:hypothetical protein
MQTMHQVVRGTAAAWDTGAKPIRDFIAQQLAALFPGIGQLAELEMKLRLAEEALRLAEGALAIAEGGVEQVRAWLDQVAGDLKVVDDAIQSIESQVANANAEFGRVEERIRNLTNARWDLLNEASRLRGQLAGIPQYVWERVCQNVCDWLPWPIGEVCDLICNWVQRVNGEWNRVVGLINDVEGRARELARQIDSEVSARTSLSAQIEYLQNERQRLLGDRGPLQLTKDSVDAQLAVAQQTLATARDGADKAASVAAKARQELADLRARLGVPDAITRETQRLVEQLDLVRAYLLNWKEGIEVSTREFVQASLVSARSIVQAAGNPLTPYKQWFSCYGGAFTPTPYQIPEGICRAESEYQRIKAELDRLIQIPLPEPFNTIKGKVDELRNRVEKDLKNAAETAALNLIEFVSNDGVLADFIGLIAHPENATEAKLNEVFATSEGDRGKGLLVFPQVSALIKTDLALGAPGSVADRFVPFRHARTMAKLSLLGRGALSQLIRAHTTKVPGYPSGPKGERRYSALLGAVRSLDGNHQWQPYGLPYARKNGRAVPDARKRELHEFGWPPDAKGRGGFVLFVNPTLRATVFRTLFPESPGGVLMTRPEYQEPYPFPSCLRNPFPTTFDGRGEQRPNDLSCSR